MYYFGSLYPFIYLFLRSYRKKLPTENSPATIATCRHTFSLKTHPTTTIFKKNRRGNMAQKYLRRRLSKIVNNLCIKSHI